MPDNEHLIIAVKSSPVKKPEETGAALPVKDLFDRTQRKAPVELSSAISYQVIGYVEYNLEFSGLNAIQAGNRHKPTALATTFKLFSYDVTIFVSYQNSSCRTCRNKTKTLLRYTVKIQIHNSIKFFHEDFVNFLRFFHSECDPFSMKRLLYMLSN